MTNKDTRYHRLDTVNENAKFLLSYQAKSTAIKYCTDSIAVEQGNEIAVEFWLQVKKAVEESNE